MTRTAMLVLVATSFAGASSAEAPRITTACEQALALSALPAHLRGSASVYVLEEGRYHKAVEGSGPFTCIVERNHAESVIPQCVDAAGRDTILPAIIHRSERIVAGEDADAVRQEFERRAAAGEFSAPARPGISYMASDYNYIYVAPRKSLAHVPAHLMFYGPNLANEDIGGSYEHAHENRGMPFMVDHGIHAYMISYVEHASDSSDVEASCAGQLGAAPPPLAGGD